MSLHEEDYWPERLVIELKSLVRKQKFDFNAVSLKLNDFWRVQAGGDSHKDIDISPKTCREAFARDYSRAPYAKDRMKTAKTMNGANSPSSEAAEEVKTAASPPAAPSSTRLPISVTEEDEAEASAFNFDIEQAAAPAAPTESNKEINEAPLPATDGPDLSYEQVLENLEKIEESNFKRKEAVFTKVAKLLMLDGYAEDDDHSDGNNKETSNAVSSRGRANPMDAEVLRAFQEGRKKRAEDKVKRAAALAEAEEWRKIKSDRERLRHRFDTDSEDAIGDRYDGDVAATSSARSPGGNTVGRLSEQEEAEKEQYERYVRTMLGGGLNSTSSAAIAGEVSATVPSLATDSKSKIQQEVYRQLIVDTIAAKYNGAVDEAAAAAAARVTGGSSENAHKDSSMVEATGTSSPSTPAQRIMLGAGFLDSAEFDEILTALETEQAQQAQEKGRTTGEGGLEGGDSDMADVLAILDAAAASNASVSPSSKDSEKEDAARVFGDDGEVANMMNEMLAVSGMSTVPNRSSGKVLLRAGLGTSQRPHSPSSSGNNVPKQDEAHTGTAAAPSPRNVSSDMEQETKHDQADNVRGSGYAARGGRGGMMGRTSTASVPGENEDSDDGSDDEDFAGNWKAKRAAAKAKATAIQPAAGGTGRNANLGVYGFGGAGKGAMQGNYGKSTRSAAGASKEVSVERSTDRGDPLPLPPTRIPESAAEESKASGATPSTTTPASPTSPLGSTASTASRTPLEVNEVWKDVHTPPAPPTSSQVLASELAAEAVHEEEAEDIAPVAIGSSISASAESGLLASRIGSSRRKGKMPLMGKK